MKEDDVNSDDDTADLSQQMGQHIPLGSMAAAVGLGATLEDLEVRFGYLTAGDRELYEEMRLAWQEHRERNDGTVFWIPSD